MLPEAMITTLKSLKLFGMAQAVEELAAQNSPAYLNAQSILDSLLKAELAELKEALEQRGLKLGARKVYAQTFERLHALAAKALGVDDQSIREGLLQNEVQGRMNLFEKDGVTVLVDYAHNFLSFQKLYESLKADYPGQRIVVVVGCPGGKAQLRRRDIGTGIRRGRGRRSVPELDRRPFGCA